MIVSATLTDSREDEVVDAVRSVVDHVDRVLLIDTGATDRTLARAEGVAGAKFAVASHTWVDFATARNASVDAARALGAEWVVVLDTDERLDFGSVDLRAALARTTADVLLVEQADGSYPKARVLRAAAGARYVGPTHETLRGGVRETLRGATFSELGKTDEQATRKFARDVAVLTRYVADHPDDPRWWYYLGQSLEGLGARERAADAFGQCVLLGKFGEEAAWAAYRQADQLRALGRREEAVVAAARGLAASASSAECAWVAAASALDLGRADQAVAWARVAEAVGRFRGCGPARDSFRHLPALYELPYDVLRTALPDGLARTRAEADFHAARRARVAATDPRSLDRISLDRRVSAASREEARAMLRPRPIATTCPSARAARIRFDPPAGWHPMNPSVCWHDGAVWCVVRTVNYAMTGRDYAVDDPDGVVRTVNYLGRLSRSGKFVRPRAMCDLDQAPRRPTTVVGYEDVRLVSVRGKLAGSATVCDRDRGRRLIAKLDLDARGDVRRATVQPSNQLAEKNWMPFARGGEFAWVYSLDPTCVVPGPLWDCPLALEHLRGGAAAVLGGGLLCVVHEVVETAETRVYLHRFVKLDRSLRVVAVSPAWVFAHHGIEFCAGLLVDGDELVLSYGIEDCEAWVVRVKLGEIEAMEWVTP